MGGHWGVLQMVAWARMISDYTEERGLLEGVKETFDGRHACAMCKKIATEKGKEQQKQLPLTKSGQENLGKWFGLSSVMALPEPRWSHTETAVCPGALQSPPTQWDAPPPVPPPELTA